MALFLEQNDNQTELQKRIAADLREKSLRSSLDGGAEGDKGEVFLEDNSYIEGTKETTSLAAVWALVFVAVVITVVYFLIFT